MPEEITAQYPSESMRRSAFSIRYTNIDQFTLNFASGPSGTNANQRNFFVGGIANVLPDCPFPPSSPPLSPPPPRPCAAGAAW